MIGKPFRKGDIPWNKNRKAGKINNCLKCDKAFYVEPRLVGARKYCSHKCQLIWNKGKKNSQIPWNKGLRGVQPRSAETRMKISKALKGSKSYRWKGGITSENLAIRHSIEYKLWREAIFKRDEFVCQSCGEKSGKLNADHIRPFAIYPELRFAIDNGQTLCEECHIVKTKADKYIYFNEKFTEVN